MLKQMATSLSRPFLKHIIDCLSITFSSAHCVKAILICSPCRGRLPEIADFQGNFG